MADISKEFESYPWPDGLEWAGMSRWDGEPRVTRLRYSGDIGSAEIRAFIEKCRTMNVEVTIFDKGQNPPRIDLESLSTRPDIAIVSIQSPNGESDKAKHYRIHLSSEDNTSIDIGLALVSVRRKYKSDRIRKLQESYTPRLLPDYIEWPGSEASVLSYAQFLLDVRDYIRTMDVPPWIEDYQQTTYQNNSVVGDDPTRPALLNASHIQTQENSVRGRTNHAAGLPDKRIISISYPGFISYPFARDPENGWYNVHVFAALQELLKAGGIEMQPPKDGIRYGASYGMHHYEECPVSPYDYERAKHIIQTLTHRLDITDAEELLHTIGIEAPAPTTPVRRQAPAVPPAHPTAPQMSLTRSFSQAVRRIASILPLFIRRVLPLSMRPPGP